MPQAGPGLQLAGRRHTQPHPCHAARSAGAWGLGWLHLPGKPSPPIPQCIPWRQTRLPGSPKRPHKTLAERGYNPAGTGADKGARVVGIHLALPASPGAFPSCHQLSEQPSGPGCLSLGQRSWNCPLDPPLSPRGRGCMSFQDSKVTHSPWAGPRKPFPSHRDLSGWVQIGLASQASMAPLVKAQLPGRPQRLPILAGEVLPQGASGVHRPSACFWVEKVANPHIPYAT